MDLVREYVIRDIFLVSYLSYREHTVMFSRYNNFELATRTSTNMYHLLPPIIAIIITIIIIMARRRASSVSDSSYLMAFLEVRMIATLPIVSTVQCGDSH